MKALCPVPACDNTVCKRPAFRAGSCSRALQHALQPTGSVQRPLTSQRLLTRLYPDKCFYFKKKKPCQEGLCVTGCTAAAHTTHLPSSAGKKITSSAQRKSSNIKQQEQQRAPCHTAAFSVSIEASAHRRPASSSVLTQRGPQQGEKPRDCCTYNSITADRVRWSPRTESYALIPNTAIK